jgi:hypothetical protein
VPGHPEESIRGQRTARGNEQQGAPPARCSGRGAGREGTGGVPSASVSPGAASEPAREEVHPPGPIVFLGALGRASWLAYWTGSATLAGTGMTP